MNTQAETQVPSPAPASPSGPAALLGSPLFFIAAMFLLMWALLIRPQQRRDKEQKAMLAQIERGDAIVMTSGLHGRVTGVADDVLTVEIAPNVRVKVSRSAVASRSAGKPEDKS
ncbi:MAG TPA: preprotein translocase subunit YajC [Myxococcota bacterium]|nr:preprotein translocase subunit YajC [Myxococcota bacterium]